MRAGATTVAGMDEVGRGALSGPVSVGVVVVDAAVRSLPGVRDSKLLSAPARQELVPRIRTWARAWAVGHAQAEEIDEVGIIAALRRAGLRALAAVDVAPDVIVLDGSHDWLSLSGQGDLFEDMAPSFPLVVTKVKADMSCTSVAAASVLAKTERDGLLVDLSRDWPDYRWDENKGYAAPEHIEALRRLGPTPHHRRSWRLPT